LEIPSAVKGNYPRVLAAPQRLPELAGRFIVAFSLAALVFALWTCTFDAGAGWAAREARVFPRVTVFILSALVALIVQGAAPSRGLLLVLGAGAVSGSVILLAIGPPAAGTEDLNAGSAAGRRVLVAMEPLLNLLRFEFSLFGAVLLGLCLGRDVTRPVHLIALLLCAAVGDIWLSSSGVIESVAAGHPLRLLRVPFPPPAGALFLAPAFTDILFFSAVLAAARNLRVHALSIVLGAVSGYAAGSFLALGPWAGWPALSMLLVASGVLIAAWPELKVSLRDALKAGLIAVLLLAFLIGMSMLRRKLAPRHAPEPAPEGHRYRNAT
jgi:hypothetical protein